MLPGIYAVQLQISTSLPTNPLTQMYIAQNVFTSNIVTIPVSAQVPPTSTAADIPAQPSAPNLNDQRRSGRGADLRRH